MAFSTIRRCTPIWSVIASIAWTINVAVTAPMPVVTGVVDPYIEYVLAAYYVWLLVPLILFTRWIRTDAALHHRRPAPAVAVAASWLLIPFVMTVPYLIATRGWKRGSLVGLAFLAIALAAVVLSLWLALQIGNIDAENWRES